MHRVIICFTSVVIAALSASAQSPDTPETRHREAERYMQTMNPHVFFHQFFEKATASLPAAQREEKRARLERVDIDALTRKLIDVMADCMTTEELKALADFYGSPVGQSATRKLGECMLKWAPIVRAEGEKADKKFDDDATKHK